MVSTPRLVNLYERVAEANGTGVSGDIVECGVWNGGSAALMAAACKDTQRGNASSRRIWLFDSFQGLPQPGERDGIEERKRFFRGWSRGHVDQVQRAFQTVNVPLDDVTIEAGWFDQTLGETDIESIAILHIDADWYDSVRIVLECLYDKVVAGGCIILDDYGKWKGCTAALNDFLIERNIPEVELTKVGRAGVYLRKPG
jgi:O-methyltransferase